MSTSIPTEGLWAKTPLIFSRHLSDSLHCDVYLKLENLQPSQSFKYRGISYFAQQCLKKYGPSVHLIIASGGNAALAAACVAKTLNVRCTVYIPEGASESLVNFLKKEGSEVKLVGKYYLQSLRAAENAVKDDPLGVMVPAYDDSLLWQGHSSMVLEIAEDIGRPDAIVCSVGGGGLLGGILQGCSSFGWHDVNILALETHGSACFYESMVLNNKDWPSRDTIPEGVSVQTNEQHGVLVAHVESLTSKASSLGATSPAAAVVKMAMEKASKLQCITIPDEMSMRTAALFAEDHKLLVELACATALAPAYNRPLFSKLLHSPKERRLRIVFIVCGGFKISLEDLRAYEGLVQLALAENGSWDVRCNGELWSIPKDNR